MDKTHSAIELLGTDLLSTIFSFLGWAEVLNTRVCNSCWREAAIVTPVAEIWIRKKEIARDLSWISRALPNTQAFKIASDEIKFQHGEDSAWSEMIAGDFQESRVDLSHIQNFRCLRHLVLQIDLNGKYPFIFQFEHLQRLDLRGNCRLKWDLEMLSGLPNLQTLYCAQNHSLTGDIASVRILSSTLTELKVCHCPYVTGKMENLYDLPLLETLDIDGTKVTGDIRTIGPTDFISLKELGLGDNVYGGGSIKRIDEAPSSMLVRRQLMKRSPDIFKQKRWRLDNESPERYRIQGHHSRVPPFWVEFVKIGPRVGWRWTNAVCGGCCEIRWLDPEPNPLDDCYEDYLKKLEDINHREVGFFRGFIAPPTQEEHAKRAAEVPLESRYALYGSRSSFGVW